MQVSKGRVRHMAISVLHSQLGFKTRTCLANNTSEEGGNCRPRFFNVFLIRVFICFNVTSSPSPTRGSGKVNRAKEDVGLFRNSSLEQI